MRLSKYFLLLLCFITSVSVSDAQKRIAREVHLGVVGGATLSNYRMNPNVTQSFSQGFTFGIAARYIEENHFGLAAELLFNQRGLKDQFDVDLYPNLSFERKINYLELPILADIYFNLGSRNVISLDLGPKLGFYLSDSSTSKLEGDEWKKAQSSVYHAYKHHTEPITKKFDYGIQINAGYEFKFSKQMSLQLQGRYYFGLENMFSDKKSDAFDNSANQQIQITATIWYRTQIAKFLIKRQMNKELNKRK